MEKWEPNRDFPLKTNLTYPSAKHTGKWSTTCEALRPRVSLGNAFTRISSKWLSGIVLKTVSTSDKTQSPTKFSPQWTIFLTWLLDTIRKGPAKCGPKIVCASFGSHVLCMYIYIYSKVSPFNWIPMAYGLGRPENHGHLWSLWDLDLRLATWLQLGQEMDGMVGEILTLLGTGWWSRFNFRFALKWNDGPKLLWCGQNMILIRNAGPKQFHPQCPVLFKFVTLRCHQSYEWALKCENHRT